MNCVEALPKNAITENLIPDDIILSRYPKKLTLGDVRQLLGKRDDPSRQLLADLILHRLKDRYITPLEKVPTKFRSGFLTMAAACLMIETFQCFRDGEKDTKRKGKGVAAFKNFFRDYAREFRGIDGEEFYYKIRCGILHQAQTHGRFRILRTGAIFDSTQKLLNATLFLKTLKTIVEDYVNELRVREMQAECWANALQKIEYICEAIETE
jgi:hypothetical protein